MTLDEAHAILAERVLTEYAAIERFDGSRHGHRLVNPISLRRYKEAEGIADAHVYSSVFVDRILDVSNERGEGVGMNDKMSCTPFDFDTLAGPAQGWHPSGWSPVFDAEMTFVGFTRLKVMTERLRLARNLPGDAFEFTGEAVRFRRPTDDGASFWAYRVSDGDPTEMPGLWMP